MNRMGTYVCFSKIESTYVNKSDQNQECQISSSFIFIFIFVFYVNFEAIHEL